MSDEKKIPKRRFKQFLNASTWEQRKLGEVVERVSCTSKDSEIPQVEYEDIISGEGRLNKDITKKLRNKKGILFRKGDILYGKLRPYLKNWLLPDFSGKAVGDFWVLRSEKVQSSFLYNLIQSNRFELASNQSTGTKMPRADWNLVANTEFPIPVSIEEQISIGNIFELLNNSITLHQRKLNKLEKLKKAYLEELFPAGNQCKPKRRFKEFKDDWEQRKLGEYSVIITGGTPSTRILEYWSPKEIPWMSSGEINKKRISKTEDRISKLGLEQSSARWVKKNSILIALAGQGKTRGTVAINEVELTTNQSIAAIELDNSLNTEFVFQNLDSRYDELRKESSGDGTRGGLNKKIISDLYIPYTEYKEQDVIGHFFKKLDNLITLHQHK